MRAVDDSSGASRIHQRKACVSRRILTVGPLSKSRIYPPGGSSRRFARSGAGHQHQPIAWRRFYRASLLEFPEKILRQWFEEVFWNGELSATATGRAIP